MEFESNKGRYASSLAISEKLKRCPEPKTVLESDSARSYVSVLAGSLIKFMNIAAEVCLYAGPVSFSLASGTQQKRQSAGMDPVTAVFSSAG